MYSKNYKTSLSGPVSPSSITSIKLHTSILSLDLRTFLIPYRSFANISSSPQFIYPMTLGSILENETLLYILHNLSEFKVGGIMTGDQPYLQITLSCSDEANNPSAETLKHFPLIIRAIVNYLFNNCDLKQNITPSNLVTPTQKAPQSTDNNSSPTSISKAPGITAFGINNNNSLSGKTNVTIRDNKENIENLSTLIDGMQLN